jgi:hypothetical protein
MLSAQAPKALGDCPKIGWIIRKGDSESQPIVGGLAGVKQGASGFFDSPCRLMAVRSRKRSPFFKGIEALRKLRRVFCGRGSSLVCTTPPVVPLAKLSITDFFLTLRGHECCKQVGNPP